MARRAPTRAHRPTLVTGGTGLTGQFVVEELLRRDRPVRIVCRAQSSEKAHATAVDVLLGDLHDPDSLAAAARGTGGIVHTASTYTDSAVDIAAMEALLSAWEAGPFVFISSLDVYGFVAGDPVTEDEPLSETYGDYGYGKVVCERLLADAAARAGRSDYAILRAPHIWGPHPTAYRRLVVERILDRQPIVLPGSAEQEWRQYGDAWIDVRDLATIVVECLERPAGAPLNVLTGHFVWHDVYRELMHLTDSDSELIHKPLDAIADDELPRKAIYAQTWRFSEARLVQHLGEIPRRPLDLTLRDTVSASCTDSERTRPTRSPPS